MDLCHLAIMLGGGGWRQLAMPCNVHVCSKIIPTGLSVVLTYIHIEPKIRVLCYEIKIDAFEEFKWICCRLNLTFIQYHIITHS